MKFVVHPFLRNRAILDRFALPTPYLSSQHKSAVTPLESAVTQVFILKDFKSSRMNTYKKPIGGCLSQFCPSRISRLSQIGNAFSTSSRNEDFLARKSLPALPLRRWRSRGCFRRMRQTQRQRRDLSRTQIHILLPVRINPLRGGPHVVNIGPQLRHRKSSRLVGVYHVWRAASPGLVGHGGISHRFIVGPQHQTFQRGSVRLRHSSRFADRHQRHRERQKQHPFHLLPPLQQLPFSVNRSSSRISSSAAHVPFQNLPPSTGASHHRWCYGLCRCRPSGRPARISSSIDARAPSNSVSRFARRCDF